MPHSSRRDFQWSYLLLVFFSAGPVNVPWQLDTAVMYVCHATAPVGHLIIWLIFIRSRNLPSVNLPHRLDIPSTWKVVVRTPVAKPPWHSTIELVRDEDGHHCWKHRSDHWHRPSVTWTSILGSKGLMWWVTISGRKKVVPQSRYVGPFKNSIAPTNNQPCTLLMASGYC